MKPFPDFSTTTGVRRVAEHLETLASDPELFTLTEDHVIGHLKIRPTYPGLTKAAKLLRENAHAPAYRVPTAMQTNVMKMDAVRHCGSPDAALETIRRQLDTQRESMETSDVKRYERAARLIEEHIEAVARKVTQEAKEDALLARVAAGKEPDNQSITATGTEVHVNYQYREYLGTVSGCKLGPHPLLGKNHPTALYTVTISHFRETKKGRYAFHPVKPKTFRKIIWNQIRILG